MDERTALGIANEWSGRDPEGGRDTSEGQFRGDCVRVCLEGLIPDPVAWAFFDPPSDEGEQTFPGIAVLDEDAMFFVEPSRTGEDRQFVVTAERRQLPDDVISLTVGETIDRAHGTEYRNRGWLVRIAGRDRMLGFRSEENMGASQPRPTQEETFCRALAKRLGWPT